MERTIRFIDRLTAWFGKAFAWCILGMTFGIAYEVFVRYVLNSPTSWAFDMSYMMYGALFMMGGAYTLSRNGHVRGDFVYRLWRPRTQARVELTLYFLFFFPGVLALIFAGWKYAERSAGWKAVSCRSCIMARSRCPPRRENLSARTCQKTGNVGSAAGVGFPRADCGGCAETAN